MLAEYSQSQKCRKGFKVNSLALVIAGASVEMRLRSRGVYVSGQSFRNSLYARFWTRWICSSLGRRAGILSAGREHRVTPGMLFIARQGSRLDRIVCKPSSQTARGWKQRRCSRRCSRSIRGFLSPAYKVENRVHLCSARKSQERARPHSRFTVRTDMPRAAAVSSAVSPPK
jgi:hypothetical protein